MVSNLLTNVLFKKRSPPPGSRPGTLALGDEALPTRLRITRYDGATVEERELADPGELEAVRRAGGVLWVRAQGLGSEKLLRRVRKAFGLHPLVLEGIVNAPQRPKYESFDDHALFVVRRLSLGEGDGLVVEQISIVLGSDFVLSFEENYDESLEPVHVRVHEGRGPIRKAGADYLAYALVDTVVDGYYPVLERLAELLDRLEERVMSHPIPDTLRRLQRVKRTLLLLRRAAWPTREALGRALRERDALIGEETLVYLRDTYDHCVQVAEVVDSYRELVTELTNTYLSMVSNRMNEIMKVLTIMASIFIPLTFVAGIYGMNFEHMPELHSRWAYPLVIATMLAIAGGMLGYFRHKKWIGGDED